MFRLLDSNALDACCCFCCLHHFKEIRYTGLGYGEVVFKELREHFAVAEILAFVSIGYLLLLYVLDGFIGLLDDALGKLRFVGIVLAVLALAAAILLSADYYPSAPALVFIFGACASAAAARRYFLHTAEAAEFLAGLAATAVVLGVVVFAAWFCWVILLDNNWSERRQEMYEDGVTCSNSAEAKSGQRCRAAYLMWALPAIVSTLYAITAAICTYLSASIVRHNRGKDSIHPAVRLLILVAALGVSGVWIAVSLSGVEMEVSEILLQVTVLFVALTTFICSAAISLADFYNETQEIPLFQKLQKFLGTVPILLSVLTDEDPEILMDHAFCDHCNPQSLTGSKVSWSSQQHRSLFCICFCHLSSTLSVLPVSSNVAQTGSDRMRKWNVHRWPIATSMKTWKLS